jgi:hypothetical protein
MRQYLGYYICPIKPSGGGLSKSRETIPFKHMLYTFFCEVLGTSKCFTLFCVALVD